MQRSKEEIVDHFQRFIFGFIYKDIETCIKYDAKYVAALALLSYTEYIGGLISGNLGLKDKGKDNFNRALEFFPKAYQDIDFILKVEYADEKGQTKSDTGIYGLFRCGMVHEYFSKGLGPVINDPNGHAEAHRIGIEVIPVETLSTGSQEKCPIFYTNEYFRDFKLAIDKIFKLLTIDKDEELLKRFNESLDRIYSRRIL